VDKLDIIWQIGINFRFSTWRTALKDRTCKYSIKTSWRLKIRTVGFNRWWI